MNPNLVMKYPSDGCFLLQNLSLKEFFVFMNSEIVFIIYQHFLNVVCKFILDAQK